MGDDRYSRWVRASFASARFEKFMPAVVQMLGRLDCSLINEDARHGQLPPHQRDLIPEVLRASDQHTLSYLWVLGAYEVTRTIEDRARNGSYTLSQELADRLRSAKARFTRLRIPLAKMVPAKKHAATDSLIAYPGQHPTMGVTWHIAEGVFVTRRELSDMLLELLEDLRADAPAFPQGTDTA